MATTLLDLFPALVAIGHYTDASGRRVPVFLSPEFGRALQQVLERIGGATGPSITDLATADDEDSGLEEFRAEQAKHNDAADMLPVPVFPAFDDPMHPLAQAHAAYEDPMHPIAQQHAEAQQLTTELNGLREEVAVLRQLINDIQQGLYA